MLRCIIGHDSEFSGQDEIYLLYKYEDQWVRFLLKKEFSVIEVTLMKRRLDSIRDKHFPCAIYGAAAVDYYKLWEGVFDFACKLTFVAMGFILGSCAQTVDHAVSIGVPAAPASAASSCAMTAAAVANATTYLPLHYHSLTRM